MWYKHDADKVLIPNQALVSFSLVQTSNMKYVQGLTQIRIESFITSTPSVAGVVTSTFLGPEITAAKQLKTTEVTISDIKQNMFLWCQAVFLN